MLFQKEYYHKEIKGLTGTNICLADAYAEGRRFTSRLPCEGGQVLHTPTPLTRIIN